MKRYGDTGNNVIYAQSGDWVYGGAGDDELHSRPSVSGIANRLYGGAHNDKLFGYSGDMLNGGSGNDQFTLSYNAARAPTTIIEGGSGYDSLTFLQAGSVLYFNLVSGIEQITGPSGATLLVRGTAGDDVLDFRGVTLTNVRIDAGNGNDYVISSGPLLNSDLEYLGGLGNDKMVGGGKLTGNSGNDYLVGSALRDILSGGGGDDTIYGGAGDDRIDAGDGLDYVEGGAGNDSIGGFQGEFFGGSGNDRITGGQYLYGGSGNDYLTSDLTIPEHDFPRPNPASTRIMDGGLGDDIFKIYGDNDDDPGKFAAIVGGDGYDILRYQAHFYAYFQMSIYAANLSGVEEIQNQFGSSGYLSILGSSGDDILDFASIKVTAPVTIRGGAGNDEIALSSGLAVEGGAGKDDMTGSVGVNRFEFLDMADSGLGNNADIIRSFTSGQDKIDFSPEFSTPDTTPNFTYLGTKAFTATGKAELRYFVDGANSWIQADADGNGVADLELSMIGIQQFVAADFIL
jgi:Ca2+-binding RTX toxin-like protein